MNKALVVVDMVNDFASLEGSLYVPNTAKIIEPIKAKIKGAKEVDIPVIFVNDSHEEDDREFKVWPKHCVKGTEGAKIIKELDTTDSTTIGKTTFSGFFETILDGELKRKGITELILVGCVTNICILHTATDAVLRGYKVTVPRDCVAGLDKADEDAAFKHMAQILNVDVLG